MIRTIFSTKGAFSLFFFILVLHSNAQQIFWKGKELKSADHKTIDGEIELRNPEDTIKARHADIYQNPKRAILKGDFTLRSNGMVVTGDSGIYYPSKKLANVIGNAVINSAEGAIKSNAFMYDMNTKILTSNSFTSGTANGIRFKSDRCIIFSGSRNLRLIGHAEWENDTVKGIADTIYLDKSTNLLKMSKKARIIFKKKNDEIAGKMIEIDLKTNKISRSAGTQVTRKDVKIKAKEIIPTGDDYLLKGDVEIASTDSAIISSGQKAVLGKKAMDMEGSTKTRIMDKEKKELFIYSPFLTSRKEDSVERYNFFHKINIRGQFDGYGDSLSIIKTPKSKEIFLVRNAHIQNDSMYIEADTIEIYKDSLVEIIRAKRNSMMVMITKPKRVNLITAAYIQLTKTDSVSEMYAVGDSESFLWNDEKSNVGINNTKSPSQKAIIKKKKISKVTTKGVTQSNFQPIQKIDYGYLNPISLKLKESYKKDTLPPNLKPIKFFLKK